VRTTVRIAEIGDVASKCWCIIGQLVDGKMPRPGEHLAFFVQGAAIPADLRVQHACIAAHAITHDGGVDRLADVRKYFTKW
jgi:hypothetical protein